MTLNRLLAKFDIALTRRTTLDRTRAQLADSLEQARRLSAELASERDAALRQPMLADLLQPLQAELSLLKRQGTDIERSLIRHQTACQWSVIDEVERRFRPASSRRTCPLCGAENDAVNFVLYRTQCLFGGGDLVRYQCPDCDVIFGADKMFELTEAQLSQEYEWHYKVYEEGDSTEVEMMAFHSLKPRKDGVYVNFGSGAWSSSVPKLREQGWNVFAYEPHSSAAGTHEWLLTRESQVAELTPDGLYSNNVLEHLRHPAADLRRMAGWLKPGAAMAHATPCYEYMFEYTRFHLYFFPGRSRELLARLIGHRIEQFEVDRRFNYMNCVFVPESTTGGTS